MKWLLSIIFLLPILCFSQIKIDDVGDNWILRVDSALKVVKKYDSINYNKILTNCRKVSYWTGNFSTIEDNETILIPQKEIKYGSINNIAAILVHESTHLLIINKKLKYTPSEEEVFCYYVELRFLEKIPNVESWLITNAKKMILFYGGQ
jgi:hypothetical protein